MPFSVKDWRQYPDTSTPLSAAALEDLETRLSAYADSVSASGGTTYNIKTYGAEGIGGDDRDAIQEAIEDAFAAGGGDVLFPPCDDSYGVPVTASSTPLILRSGVRLIGTGWAGRMKRIGAYPHEMAGIRMIHTDTDEAVSHVGLHNIWIDGDESSVTLVQTQLNGAIDGVGAATDGGETTLTVDSTATFPTSGRVAISGHTVAYTGKTATQFTGCTGATFVAADNTVVYENVINLKAQCLRLEPLDVGQWHEYFKLENCGFVDWPGASFHGINLRQFHVGRNTVTNSLRGGLIFFHDCNRGEVVANTVQAADDCIAIQGNGNTASASIGAGPQRIGIVGNQCESFGITGMLTNNGLNIQGLKHSAIVGNTVVGGGETGGQNKANLRISVSDGLTEAARYTPENLTISGNNFSDSNEHGIYLSPDSTVTEPAQGIYLLGNSVADSGQHACFLDGYVDDLKIDGLAVMRPNANSNVNADAVKITDAHNYEVTGLKVRDAAAHCRFGLNVLVANTNGWVHHNYCPDSDFSTRGFNNDTVASSGVLFEENNPAATASLGSAATITLRDGYNHHLITGTVTITSITAMAANTIVRLYFGAVLTLTDGSNLKLNGNFVTSADDSITLRSDGTNWIELSRSAN